MPQRSCRLRRRLSAPSPLTWCNCRLSGFPRHSEMPQPSQRSSLSPSRMSLRFRFPRLVPFRPLTRSCSMGILVGTGTTSPRRTASAQVARQNPKRSKHSRIDNPSASYGPLDLVPVIALREPAIGANAQSPTMKRDRRLRESKGPRNRRLALTRRDQLLDAIASSPAELSTRTRTGCQAASHNCLMPSPIGKAELGLALVDRVSFVVVGLNLRPIDRRNVSIRLLHRA